MNPYSLATVAAPAIILAAVDSTTISITAIGAAQALVLGWFGLRQQRTEKLADTAKNKSTEQSQRVDRNFRLIDQLQEQLNTEINNRQNDHELINSLQFETRSMRMQMTRMEIGTARLIGQLEALNIEPVWRPLPEQT